MAITHASDPGPVASTAFASGDTITALGSDAMDFALEGYGQLKLSGSAQGPEDLRREIGCRFSRRRRDATPAPEPQAA